MRQGERGGYTACLRACMAAYRKLRRPGDGEGRDRRSAAGEGSTTKTKKIPKKQRQRRLREPWYERKGEDRPTTKKQLTTTARRTERWKSILWNRSVLSELAPSCDQVKPEGESSRRPPWHVRLRALNEARNMLLGEIKAACKNRYMFAILCEDLIYGEFVIIIYNYI